MCWSAIRGVGAALAAALAARGWTVEFSGTIVRMSRRGRAAAAAAAAAASRSRQPPAAAAQPTAGEQHAMKRGRTRSRFRSTGRRAKATSRFIVSDANREAFDHFRQWSMWPVKATILTGPRRSGRTLLARSFVERVGGRLFDDAERRDEEELFHAWNQAQDSGRPLVMIADMAPPAWAPQLPDLRTRLAVTPVARDRPARRCACSRR